jgi:hypothetical protein
MKYLWLFLLVPSVHSAAAQAEEARYRNVADAFMTSYNQEAYAAIFELFSPEMKAALPMEKTAEFLGGSIRAGSGDIKQMQFSRQTGGAHIYKTTFERAVLDIHLSLDSENRIGGFYVKPHTTAPVLERNTTAMDLPFKGEWFVFWGGETQAQNYHMADINQQFAYDILKVANGTSHSGDPLSNESYFAFGEVILAPCDATVAMAVDGVPDNVPGETNPVQLTGNTLVLETAAGEYILMCHLMEGSLRVGKGDEVRRGEVLAKCGNSGNSTEPHLHLQLQNTRDIHKATGARLLFHRIAVNGSPREEYMPVKEDFIKNIE